MPDEDGPAVTRPEADTRAAGQAASSSGQLTGPRRVPVIAAIVGVLALGALAALGVVAASVGGENEPTGTPPSMSPGAAPDVSDAPPTNLRLRDDSTTITVTWTDPTDGGVPFIVAGGRAGQKLGALATVDPGTGSYTIHGLNPRVNYCFTILAVYSTDRYAAAGQVCTSRGTPSPSRS